MTEFFVLASRHIEAKHGEDVWSIKVGEAEMQAARYIGVIMDSRLNMEAHFNHITSACYFNLHNICQIRRNLTK